MQDLNIQTNKWAMERLVPDLVPWYGRQTIADHLARYDFASQFVKDKTVLDIACGSGYGSQLLAKAGAKQVIGVDISKKTIEYAQKKYSNHNIKYIVGDATGIPLGDGTIDFVVSFETIEHLKDYQKFLTEIKRVLKVGGFCLISTPNNLLNDETCNEFHVHQFSQEQFVNDLKTHFKQIELFGQKPMHAGYLNIVRWITGHLPSGFIKWFVDSGLKMMFRSTAVKPIKTFKHGFIPAFFLAKGTNL